MIEIVVVLLLMGILAATVLGRSVTTSNLDLNSATDKVRNQLRYAQAEAMKRTDTVWGVKAYGNEYWLFRDTNPDNAANEVRVPGGDYPGAINRINENDLGATLEENFTIFFDRIGKPYTAYTSYTDPSANVPLAGTLSITVKAKGDTETRTITITPETGLIR
jgi:type II secretory pathway pseudopilin PulG